MRVWFTLMIYYLVLNLKQLHPINIYPGSAMCSCCFMICHLIYKRSWQKHLKSPGRWMQKMRFQTPETQIGQQFQMSLASKLPCQIVCSNGTLSLRVESFIRRRSKSWAVSSLWQWAISVMCLFFRTQGTQPLPMTTGKHQGSSSLYICK